MTGPSRYRKERPRLALVGDGQTEQIYFADVRQTDRPDDLSIHPSLPKTRGDFAGVLSEALRLKEEEYSKVVALIDMDKILGEGTEQKYLKAKREATEAGIIVLENNPCFEIWLLLHFCFTDRAFTRCDDVAAELKKTGRLPGYDKSRQFLVRAGLYSNHRHLVEPTAIRHAKMLEDRRAQAKNPLYPRAEVYKFFEWYYAQDRADRLTSGDFFTAGAL